MRTSHASSGRELHSTKATITRSTTSGAACTTCTSTTKPDLCRIHGNGGERETVQRRFWVSQDCNRLRDVPRHKVGTANTISATGRSSIQRCAIVVAIACKSTNLRLWVLSSGHGMLEKWGWLRLCRQILLRRRWQMYACPSSASFLLNSTRILLDHHPLVNLLMMPFSSILLARPS